MQPADPIVENAPAEQRRTRGSTRRWVVLGVGVVALAAAVASLLRSGPGWESRWREFQGAFRDVSWGWLIAACALCLLTYAGRALRWAVMMRPVKQHPRFWTILEATCIGFTAIVLFGRAGELVRPYLIAVREGVPGPSQMAAWVLERVLDLMMVLLIFGIALIGMSGHALGSGGLARVVETGGTIITLAGGACIAFVLAFRYLSDTMHRRLAALADYFPERLRPKVRELLAAFIDGMGCTRSGGFVALLVLYSLMEWAVIATMFAAVLWAFPATAHLAFLDVIVALGVVAIGSAVQLPGIGGGMQVATVVALTELFHVSLGSATGVALVLWAVSFLLIVPIGSFLAVREGLSLTNLAKISEKSS